MSKPLWLTAGVGPADALLAGLAAFRDSATSAEYGSYGWVGSSRLNRRTHDAVVVAAHVSGWGQPSITQGGLNDGAVAASARTHDGLDVVDVSIAGRSRADVFALVEAGMDCGIVLFVRGTPWDGVDDRMARHVHGVMVGAQHAHPDARAQLYDHAFGYAYGGGGLGGNRAYRWFGPPRRPLVEWEASRYNPVNGWRP